jgi:hypothetical protein
MPPAALKNDHDVNGFGLNVDHLHNFSLALDGKADSLTKAGS